MSRLPSLCEAKAHAKHISKTYKLKKTESQEIVSYLYGSVDWAGLKRTLSDATVRNDVDAVGVVDWPTDVEIQHFDAFMAPYLDAIRDHLESGSYVYGSLFERVINRQYNRIPIVAISSIVESLSGFELDSSSVITALGVHDETFNRILFSKKGAEVERFNTYLEQWLYGHRFYAYYHFNNTELRVISREFDVEIFRPSNKDELMTPGYSQSVCGRKWFKRYMLSYLRMLVRQFTSAGYSGTIRICKIQNASVFNYWAGKTDVFSNQFVYSLFDELLDMGGVYAWDVDSSGTKGDVGIELAFSSQSSLWLMDD